MGIRRWGVKKPVAFRIEKFVQCAELITQP
jgi:hypothetical protein